MSIDDYDDWGDPDSEVSYDDGYCRETLQEIRDGILDDAHIRLYERSNAAREGDAAAWDAVHLDGPAAARRMLMDFLAGEAAQVPSVVLRPLAGRKVATCDPLKHEMASLPPDAPQRALLRRMIGSAHAEQSAFVRRLVKCSGAPVDLFLWMQEHGSAYAEAMYGALDVLVGLDEHGLWRERWPEEPPPTVTSEYGIGDDGMGCEYDAGGFLVEVPNRYKVEQVRRALACGARRARALAALVELDGAGSDPLDEFAVHAVERHVTRRPRPLCERIRPRPALSLCHASQAPPRVAA